MSEKLLEEIERRLNAKTIHDLRQLARAVGVPRPADGRKERILEYIVNIAAGKCDPVAPSVRGAHPKSAEYDRQLVSDILRCREICLAANGQVDDSEPRMKVSSGEDRGDYNGFTAEGILEKSDGRWFIRVNGCREDFISDIFVNDYYVNLFGLREGDWISGKCKRHSPDELAGLVTVNSVNGVSPENLSHRMDFESLTPLYPEKRLHTEYATCDFAGRIIDILSPVAAGQRAMVTGPHGSGKTAVLKDIARGIRKNNPGVILIVLLIDARPEEAAGFRRAFPDIDVFTSSFDAGAQSHIRTARLALEYAKRKAESQNDVVLILDDLTRLTLAYNSCGKQVSNALDISSLDSAKKFLAAARNAEEGASLTIISALSSSDDCVESAIYSGLKDLCNMRVTLSSKLARLHIYPPVVIDETCAYGDADLLEPEELKASAILRGQTIQDIIELLTQTENNVQLCRRLRN